MTPANRTTLINKTHRTLKKHYKPVPPDPHRSLLEHLLYACCLENSPPDAAERCFALLQPGEKYFDLNEVRVTTTRELADVLSSLNDPQEAAGRVKGVLQHVFESLYSFDLENLKKQNIGQAVQTLEEYDGVTPFALAYVTQAALGGHAIPLNRGSLEVFVILGVASPEEAEQHKVPGLERAIPKNKGIEFGSLLQQFGAVFYKTPHSPTVRKILLDINPECKERLPKRRSKKTAEAAEAAETVEGDSEAVEAARAKKASTKKSAAKKTPKKTAKKAAKKTKKKAAAKKKTSTKPSKRLARRKPR